MYHISKNVCFRIDLRALAYERTLEFFNTVSGKELITLTDLHRVMSTHCSNPYGPQHLKNKLLNHYGERISFITLCGKNDVIMERESLPYLINQLHEQQQQDPSSEEKHILEAAAKILGNIARSYEHDPTVYFSLDEINTDFQLNALPEQYKIFLNGLRSNRSTSDDSLPILALGQSMMHLSAKHYIPPLHVALATEIHTKSGSQLLIDLLHSFRMVSSAKICRNFERNAAVQKSLQLLDESDEEEDGGLWSADNVDVLKQGGTFHGMGIILAHRLKRIISTKIQRRQVSTAEILRMATKVKEVPSCFSAKAVKNVGIILREVVNVQGFFSQPQPSGIDYLRVCVSVTKDVPQSAGCMHVMTKANALPEPHCIDFLPIIGIPSTNWKCVFTTLDYIIEQHKRLKLPGKAVVTFDQPLWHKAMVLTKHLNLPVVLLLGNFHTQMSFLGSIGYVMANSGIEQALGLIYGEDSIKWILCGKSYERAMRSHGLAVSALKKILLEQVKYLLVYYSYYPFLSI